MATSRKEILEYEFTENGSVVGRATWLGPGMVELDFHDARLRQVFKRCLAEPQHRHGPVFESVHVEREWPDTSKSHFADACRSMTNLYRVRRVH